MMIVGHRGSSAAAPENTLASFALAWEEEAGGIEFDVLLTRDGHVVVHHDANTRRTTGRDARVSELLLDEIRRWDAGSWKSPRWKDERVPTLTEVMALTPKRRRLFIEVKCGPEILPALRRDVEQSGLEQAQAAFVGFSPDTMRAVKAAFPSHDVLLNVEPESYGGGAVKELIAAVRRWGLDGIGPGVRHGLDRDAIRTMLTEGLEVFVWTVDEVATARVLRDMGVHYVVTNQPGVLRQQLLH